MKAAERQLYDELAARRAAYTRVFEVGNASPDDLRIVMLDLARFCRAEVTTFHPDVRQSAMLDGRREVWLRIRDHLMLTSDDLWIRYHKRG